VSEEQRITFKLGEAFPPDDSLAQWVMALSLALNDMRIAAEYAVRAEQPFHERQYFVRLLASHMREAVKLVLLEHKDRADIQEFVASMPSEGREALEEVEMKLSAALELRPEQTLFEEIKRIRDDYFHYARDAASKERLRDAMVRASPEEGSYLISDRALRAEFADVVSAFLVHPFDGSQLEALARELHGRIVELIGPLSLVLHHAEAHYLRTLPDDILRMPRSASGKRHRES
jgi:hypothetical protein